MFKRPFWIVIAFVAVIVFGSGTYLMARYVTLASIDANRDAVAAHADIQSMDECEVWVIRRLKQDDHADVSTLVNVSQYCFSNAVRRAQLTDFTINRTLFGEQKYMNHVLLWMVVAITVSGVLLAGVQLIYGYRLAAVRGVTGSGGSDSDPRLGGTVKLDTKGKLSVESSVTGILMLIISFAFFFIFVNEIYTIKDKFIDPADNAASQTEKSVISTSLPAQNPSPYAGVFSSVPGANLLPGGFGPAKSASAPNAASAASTKGHLKHTSSNPKAIATGDDGNPARLCTSTAAGS